MRHGRILCYTLLSGKFLGEILDILALEDSNIQSQPGEKTRQLLTPRETES